MVDLFRWAYLKSAERYDVVRQSIGEVDEFRVRYRNQRKECIGEIIRRKLPGEAIETFVMDYCQNNNIDQMDRFIASTLADLENLHIGALVGIRVTEAQYNAWKKLSSK